MRRIFLLRAARDMSCKISSTTIVISEGYQVSILYKTFENSQIHLYRANGALCPVPVTFTSQKNCPLRLAERRFDTLLLFSNR